MLEDEIGRILGLADVDALAGVERLCRIYGHNATTGMIVFRSWLSGHCFGVRPLIKWADRIYQLDPFVPLADDVSVFGRREAVLKVRLTESGLPRQKVRDTRESWCDALAGISLNRRLSFGMRVDDGQSVRDSYNLEPLWLWSEGRGDSQPSICVFLDPSALFLRSDLSQVEPAIEAACLGGRELSEQEANALPSGAGPLIFERGRLRDDCARLDTIEAQRSVIERHLLSDWRTPWDVVEELRRIAGEEHDSVASMEGEDLWQIDLTRS